MCSTLCLCSSPVGLVAYVTMHMGITMTRGRLRTILFYAVKELNLSCIDSKLIPGGSLSSL